MPVAKIYIPLILVFFSSAVFAAQKPDSSKADTSHHLSEVRVKAYLSDQAVLSVPASVNVLSPAQLNLQPNNSLVSALNTVPGVRMEERSPGSYRLSLRGSLLRSPFGVRDVKIYFDELPLTDAGGNTYLNAIDVNSVQGIEVLKGPDGSLFGANSGGVVLISPVSGHADSNFVSAGINGGSYKLLHENAAFQNQTANNLLNINQAYETYGGYRKNSSMYRHYFQGVDEWKYAKNDELKVLGFYSDLHYQAPGGLTLAQLNADPTASRPATPTLPSAIAQNNSITSKMLYGGVVNNLQIAQNFRNVFALYGTYVDFTNPSILNYENRYEGTYGLRTYFEYVGNQSVDFNWKANVGLEWQQTNADINNYDNNLGVRGEPQTLDKINTNQHFIFGRYTADSFKRLHVEAALSVNFYDYKFKNVFPNNEDGYTTRSFTPQLMPRFALSYYITNNFAWRASVSRGYSTPTTGEIRPDDEVINTNLKAEYGWNYETGFRLRNSDESMFLDASVFYYKLNNAIVVQQRPDGSQYYVNEGGTNQPGAELAFTGWIIKQNDNNFIRGLQVNESLTFDWFKFTETKKQLTGVPEQVILSSVQVKFPAQLYLFVQHNYTSSLPLNDANSVFAPRYHLLSGKIGWQQKLSPKSSLEIYVGGDNLLNTKYSLGNDLNAAGNRYYNPAALRNYYAGLKVTI